MKTNIEKHDFKSRLKSEILNKLSIKRLLT